MKNMMAALRYARRGWHVFPAPPGQKKSYKSAAMSGGRKWGKTRDEQEIREDWRRWPDANVGLPTGKDSGFWVLEADTHAAHGVDGIASLRALEEQRGPLPPTRMARSPSGSTHYYFKWRDGVEIKNSASRVAPGVDVRGEGGMVIAPPSSRHDGEYQWVSEEETAEAPAWLEELCLAASRRETSHDRSAAADLDRLRLAMRHVPNDNVNWEEWNVVAMATFAATGGSSQGLEIFHEWSKRSDKYHAGRTDEKWQKMHQAPPTNIGAGTIYFKASEACPGWDRISVENFYAHLPSHDYIFVPTRDHWPAASVDAVVPRQPLTDALGQPILDSQGNPKKIKASAWLDRNRSVVQIVWAPGNDRVIKNKVLQEGGWKEERGSSAFNRYFSAPLVRGDAVRAGPWLDHCDKLLGETGREHLVKWLAHRVQKPQEKINHAVVLGGAPGIGKDTLLEPVKHAVGHWNFAEASPAKMLGTFNARYLESVVLRISEARDLGDVSRYDFYEHMKMYTAAPPDVIMVNEKFVKEYPIFNCVGVIYTTNYRHNSLYLPADDRRHYVVWSPLTAADFDNHYWDDLWDWYDSGGDDHVAAYLKTLDISDFNPKMAPPRTDAFYDIVSAGDAPEDAELADVIDAINNPGALTVSEIKSAAGFGSDFDTWLSDRRTRRIIPHRLEKCGYESVKNPDAADGVWKVAGRRTPIYARVELSPQDQVKAARECKDRLEARGPRLVP